MLEEFNNYCSKGDIISAKNLYKNNTNLYISNISFKEACNNGHLDIAIWLLEINSSNMFEINEHTFKYACTEGHLNIAIWLLKINPNIDISIINNSNVGFTNTFDFICYNGHLDVIKWLIKLKPELISKINNNVFKLVCTNGHLDFAKWIFEINPNIDILTLLNSQMGFSWTFDYICSKEYTHIIKWLFEIKPDIIYKINNDIIYRIIMNSKQSEIIEFIFQIKPDLKVIFENTIAASMYFSHACERNSLELVKYLYSLNTFINIDDKNFIDSNIDIREFLCSIRPNDFKQIIIDDTIDYVIRDTAERNWLKKRSIILAYNSKENSIKNIPIEMLREICSFL